MNIINLTPHTINIGTLAIPASGHIARVAVTRRPLGDIDGIPTYAPTFGDVTGLPDMATDTIYIVSAMVRSHPALADRLDVCSPGQPVRDDAGQIIGCDGLDFNDA